MAELETGDKGKAAELPAELRYIQYEHALEKQYLPSIRALISKDLSEPYSIYVYRYFLYQWGDLCFMVFPSLFLRCCRLSPAQSDEFPRHLASNPPSSVL
jgi:peptide alpha-N-acetyltransferase